MEMGRTAQNMKLDCDVSVIFTCIMCICEVCLLC